MGYYPNLCGPALYDFYYYYGQRTAQMLVRSVKEYLRPGARVIDVGTGTGFVALEVAPLIDGGHVIGVDVDEDPLFLARHKAARSKLSNVTFQRGDATNLEFDDASLRCGPGRPTLRAVRRSTEAADGDAQNTPS